MPFLLVSIVVIPNLNFCSIFFFFSWPDLWHMKVPGLGVKLELQLPTYATALAMQYPSHICDLHHCLWQFWSLNPLRKALTHPHGHYVHFLTCWATVPENFCSISKAKFFTKEIWSSSHSLVTICYLASYCFIKILTWERTDWTWLLSMKLKYPWEKI